MDALFTVAAFNITQENVLTLRPVPGFSVQQGEIRSRGVELEAQGAILEGSILANFEATVHFWGGGEGARWVEAAEPGDIAGVLGPAANGPKSALPCAGRG